MFRVLINGPTNVFCDNHGVVCNTLIPESTLNKKHNAVNYHIVQEAVAAKILRLTKEESKTNKTNKGTTARTKETAVGQHTIVCMKQANSKSDRFILSYTLFAGTVYSFNMCMTQV
jgi:hypothetical protein